ncbi:LSU ribosomal protein L10P [Aminomonas paucivorans DSM 12260]|uniref:Large ribosomal subunit protein uL10 n=1 Tax=Aminomonas paucivorans DSM 12260 TaxID=584708 RepID=E3CWI3_9BACT|nr:50S ribosomal protein L10 [Aminomonas paucivorans]EFQ24338.1 LSU ribosomal protein L10P [Aminomonas paucivorans DSM 12260]
MPTEAKREKIAELAEMLGKSEAVFICEYRGLTVKKVTDLRARIRKAGGEMKVAKNTLMRLALQQAGLPTADPYETGPNAYTLVYGDIAAVAKALRDYSKEKGNEALILKGGVMGKDLLNKEQVLALADLPSRDVLLAQVVGTIAAPLRSFVTVLSGPARGLVTCLSQIQDKKEKAA